MVITNMLVHLVSSDELFETVRTLNEVLSMHVLDMRLQVVFVGGRVATVRAAKWLNV